MPDPFGASSTPKKSSEDPFFVLRYCREHFQRRLTEIARLSGISSPAVLEAFSREIGEEHDELASASSTKPDGFGQTAGLTASRISLVGHDDLELDIRIGEISNHLKDNDRIDSWRVQLRYMTLLHQPKTDGDYGQSAERAASASSRTSASLTGWRKIFMSGCPKFTLN